MLAVVGNNVLDRFRKSTNFGLIVALAGLLFVALIVQLFWGVNFFKFSNLFNIARSFSILGVVSIGQALVIISGGLDLSVGAVISTSDVLAATLMDGQNVRILPVTLLCLLVGVLIGGFNGLLVTKRGVPPFIATLGTSIILEGLRLIYTQGSPKGAIPGALRYIGSGAFLGIPLILVIFILVTLFFAILLNQTLYGRRLYVTGSNPLSSRLSGVKTDRTVILAYVFCSAAAALGGVMLGAYTGTADNWAGQGYDLDSIASVVLGGGVIGGGIGNVSGTVLGGVIMVILLNLSLLAQLPIQSQMFVKGLVVIGAVWMNSRKLQRKSQT